MAENDPHAYSNWVVRCTPNLVRDEWMNVGVPLLNPRRGGFEAWFIEENAMAVQTTNETAST